LWAYVRIISGELPAEKVGYTWRLPPEAVEILQELWRARRRRASRAA
jgi:hypothetical protein